MGCRMYKKNTYILWRASSVFPRISKLPVKNGYISRSTVSRRASFTKAGWAWHATIYYICFLLLIFCTYGAPYLTYIMNKKHKSNRNFWWNWWKMLARFVHYVQGIQGKNRVHYNYDTIFSPGHCNIAGQVLVKISFSFFTKAPRPYPPIYNKHFTCKIKNYARF